MRLLALLCLCLLWAAPALAEQFGSFSLEVINQSNAPLVFQVNQDKPTAVAPGGAERFGRGYDYDQLAASPDYLFRIRVDSQGGGPSCTVRAKVEVSAWGDDYLFSCFPRRVLQGPCLLTCDDYDSVGPNSRAVLVYKPGQ